MFRIPLFPFGIVFLLLGISLFWTGWHNIDLAYNMMRWAYYENFNIDNWVDRTLGDRTLNNVEMYLSGTKLMVLSLPFMLIGIALIMISGTALFFKYL